MTERWESLRFGINRGFYQGDTIAIEILKTHHGEPSERDAVDKEVSLSIILIRNGRLKMPAKIRLLISLLPC